MKNIKRVLSFILASVMLMSGCSTTIPEKSESNSPSSVVNTSPSSVVEEIPKVDISEKVKLSIYTDNMTNGQFDSNASIKAFDEWAKMCNVEIDWQHPPKDQKGSNQQLSLTLASKNLPDIIVWNWKSMPGGLARYVEEQIILPLNEYEDSMPNYLAAWEDNPEVAKCIPLADGTIPAFYHMNPVPRTITTNGLIIRKDWLDKLDLPMPSTMDDWYTTLKAFKEKDPNGNGLPDEIPFTEALDGGLGKLDIFASPFGITLHSYLNIETKKVEYGPANKDAYKEYLMTMNKWYEEGLIDPDYATNTPAIRNSNMVNDIAGCTAMFIASGVGKVVPALKENVPTAELIGIATPAYKDGNSYTIRSERTSKIPHSAIITRSCKNIDRAVYLMDMMYSPEMRDMINYGFEGETYDIIDGKKIFKDEILHPADGKTSSEALMPYACPIAAWPRVVDYKAQTQIQYSIPEQVTSVKNWEVEKVDLLYDMNIILSAEESEGVKKLLTEIKTFAEENSLKFIIGEKSFDEYDKFHEDLMNLDVDKLVSIWQSAYDRYIAL